MGIGGFLAAQAERDHYRCLQRQTASRVLRSCDGEMEREVHGVLGPVGVDEHTSRLVARNLRDVEIETGGEGSDASSSRTQVEEGQALKWSKSVGLTAFLLKFGEGIEEVTTKRMYLSAFTIGMGYLLGGLIPLLPYFFGESHQGISALHTLTFCSSSPRTDCPHLLLHYHWHRPYHFRRCQGSHHRCRRRPRPRRIRLGRLLNATSRWRRSGGRVRSRCCARRRRMRTHVLVDF